MTNLPQILDRLGDYIIDSTNINSEYKTNYYYKLDSGVAIEICDGKEIAFNTEKAKESEETYIKCENFVNSLGFNYLECRKLYINGYLYFTVSVFIDIANDLSNFKDLIDLLIIKGYLQASDL